MTTPGWPFTPKAAVDWLAALRYAAVGRPPGDRTGSIPPSGGAVRTSAALRRLRQIRPPPPNLYDGLAYEVSLLDRLQDAADARQRALELWRAAGDQLREGDTMRRLSRTLGPSAAAAVRPVAAAEDAVSILEPLGPSTRAGLGIRLRLPPSA